jgi:prepilin-type N-terminal cleavage/methylation domain-containing protein
MPEYQVIKNKGELKVFKFTKNYGFSIIEVLIALAIFSIGILGVVTMQISSANTNRNAGKITVAYEIASGQVERLLSLDDYDDTDLSAATADNPHDGGTAGPGNSYSISWVVSEVDIDNPPDGDNDAKVIDVTVSWDDRQVTLSCIRGEDENS